jgi:RNA polymerase sigma factor (sigma-70 family)
VREPAPLRGDEGELFQRYDERLRGSVRHAVNTTPENIQDACAFAWGRLLVYQPERQSALPWLVTVAKREAIRLDRQQRGFGLVEFDPDGAVDHHDLIDATELLMDVRRKLQPLNDRERQATLLKALGWTYIEGAKRLGISKTRFNQLLARATIKMREQELGERDLSDAPPRARLLAELQRDPPMFLRSTIGRVPPANAKSGRQSDRREWSRLALAIVDYRVERGITDPVQPFGSADRERDPQRVLLETGVARYNDARAHAREVHRGMGR